MPLFKVAAFRFIHFRSFALPMTLAAIFAFPFASAPAAEREIYPAPEQASADIARGLKAAAAVHKRVILDFGGNWCADCLVLDSYLHDSGNKPILESNFVLIHINVGHMDRNQNIAERYQVPLAKGVPALAVLDQHGKLIYTQRMGDFDHMHQMSPAAVTNFLVEWKPGKAGL